MTEMEPTESTRLDVRAGEGAIVFKAGGPLFVTLFLAVWLCGWAVGEATALRNFFGGSRASEGQWFLGFWLVGWTLGGLAAAGYLIWTLFGEEVVEATPSTLTHAFRLFGLRHARMFGSHNITKIRWTDQVRGPSWSESSYLRRSSIDFDYGTRTIRFFYGAESAEAEKTIETIRARLGLRREA